MCRYAIKFTDNTEMTGMAVGTEDEVFAYLAGPGIAALTVTQADDITWPSEDECPIGG